MRPFALLTIAFTSVASAGDGALSVTLSPPVVYTGQSAQVEMFAHFPATGYAFAHTDAEVAAGIPAWSVVSAGVIAGPTVQGISVGQTHNPFIGPLADPSNPIRIWEGTYAPQTIGPMLVPITATPDTFSYYPSPLTGSAASCPAAKDRAWLFVNPLLMQGVAIAPGKGTTIRRGGLGNDVLVGGFGQDAMLVGFLAPAIQNVRIETSKVPGAIVLESQFRGWVGPATLACNATVGASVSMLPDWPLADEYEYSFGFQGQKVRLRIAAVNNRAMILDRMPQSFAVEAGHDPVTAQGDYNYWRANFGSTAAVYDPLGRLVLAESIEVRAIRYNAPAGLAVESQTIEVRTGGGGHGAGKCHFQDLSLGL